MGVAPCFLAASPQVPRPDTLPPVGVELVQVDAVVTDKQGRLVSGLGALDFELREDGKVQALSYFGVEGLVDAADTLTVAPLPPRDVPGGPLAPVTRPPVKRPRQMVLAVDDLHMSPSNLVNAREALLRFVDEQVAEDDEVALVTTSGQTGLSQSLTRDRAELKRALRRLNLLQQRRVQFDGPPHLSEYQAELIDRGDPEAIRVAVQEIMQNTDIDEPMARVQASQRAQSMLAEIMNYSGQALITLESVVRSLAPLPGRKVVLLASDGFLIGLGSSDTRHYDLRRIADAATRADVVIYSLDTRGLVSEVPGGDASFSGPPVITAPGGRESLSFRSIEALRDSLHALAEDTGGFLVHSSNDLGAGLNRILKDSRFSYVLAYESSNRKRDGKFRRLEVRLRDRPDLRVRARRGYFAPDDKKEAKAGGVAPAGGALPAGEEAARDREIVQALGSLFPLTAIPIRLVADYVDLPPDGPRAVVKALVDVRNVGFERKENAYEAELEVAGAVFDESGQLVTEIAGERSRLKLPLENSQAFREQGLLYEKAIAVKPGRYEVRLAVRDARSSLLGSARQEVEVEERETPPLSLSSIFLSADDGGPPAPAATNLRDIQVEKQLERGQGLHYLVYVYRPEAAAGSPSDVVLQAQVWSGDKLQGVGPPHPVAFPEAGAAFPRLAERIATDALPSGTYELRLLASDRKTGEKAVRRVSFTLE